MRRKCYLLLLQHSCSKVPETLVYRQPDSLFASLRKP